MSQNYFIGTPDYKVVRRRGWAFRLWLFLAVWSSVARHLAELWYKRAVVAALVIRVSWSNAIEGVAVRFSRFALSWRPERSYTPNARELRRQIQITQNRMSRRFWVGMVAELISDLSVVRDVESAEIAGGMLDDVVAHFNGTRVKP